MAKLGDLVVHIGANTTKLNASLGKVQRNMRSMTSNFTKLGMSMSKAITLPLALIGGASLRTAVKFEASMAKVKAVSGATAKEFDSLAASAKELGRTTVFTASDVSGLQLEFAKLGFSAVQINQVTGATLNLAQATGSDLAQAAEVAGATLGGFGLAATETERVTDVMAASFSSSALDINHFQESMKLVAPNAKAAGVSLEETTAMLAVLSKAGIKGSSAGTALRRILQEMQGTSGTLTERFAELNKAGLDVQGSMDEVGRRAGTSLLVLAEGAAEVEQLTEAFINSRGAAQAMADVMNDNAMGAIKRMTSALEGAGISIGEILSPAFESLVKKITGVIGSFNGLSEKLKGNILVFAGLAAVLGPFLILLPKIVAGIKLIGLAFTTATPHILAATVAISAIALLFIDTSREASKASVQIKKVETSLKDLNKTQLEIEAQVRPGAGAEQIAESMEFAALRVQEADEEIKRIQQAIADRGGFVGLGARKQLDDLTAYKEEFQRVIDASEQLIEVNKVIAEGLLKTEDGEEGAERIINTINSVSLKLHELAGMGTTAMFTLSNGVQEFAVNSSTSLLAFLNDFKVVGEEINEIANTTSQAFNNLGSQISGALVDAILDAQNFGDAMIAIGKQIIKTLLSEAIASAIANGASAKNVANQASGGLTIPAFIAAGVGSVTAAFGEIPKLAEGGIAFGRSLVEVGEYSGASGNPEVIAPLSKLKDMIGGNSIQVYGRISGDDILISNDRATRDRNRF